MMASCYSQRGTLVDILEVGLRLRPDAVAIQGIRDAITFAELDRRSESLASVLRQRHAIARGDRILCLADKSFELIVLAIAAWKVGAVYVPIDPLTPITRMSRLVAR